MYESKYVAAYLQKCALDASAGKVVYKISSGNGSVIEALSWNPRHSVLVYNSTAGVDRDGNAFCYVGIFAGPAKRA